MTPNRLLDFATWVRSRLDGMEPSALADLEKMLEIEPGEADAYRRGQVRARMDGLLNRDEALLICQALDHDGWAAKTGLELKVTITSLMDRLIAGDGDRVAPRGRQSQNET